MATSNLDVKYPNSPQVSSYDHFSAGLIASIVVFGFLVLSLAMIWLFGGDREFRYSVGPGDPDIEIKDDGNVEQPDFDEVIKGDSESELESTLEAIATAVSRVEASDGLKGKGVLSILGIRDPNPLPSPVDSFAKRWKISYEVEGVEQYKRQLDYFGIEIIVVQPTSQEVWRIGKFEAGIEVAETSRERINDHGSVFFAHVKPTLKGWDRKIIKQAGLEPENKLVVQSFPKPLIAKIIKLEAEKLAEQGRNLDEVGQTKVELERMGEHFSISISGFEFR